ncbi:hypothetical protein O6H91_11G021100 [Diphasiastrum complanatum]|uniref:Uncharacterized protein n=1 Tax=Diphasiastrum complanatum TaxID=34168 RepID=A0ACC2C738_DIPCM|nr:hypothetical protein O6H91_11G021100 [Diphasiastrum complanatum]
MGMPTGLSLTPNAIMALNSGNVDLRPVVQVLDVRQIGTAQTVQERFRLLLSDGSYVLQAMLATQLNEYVKAGQVKKGTLVQLQEYICNTVQNRKIIIVLNMEVVLIEADIIGEPKQMTSSTDQSIVTTGFGNPQQQQQPVFQPQQAQPVPSTSGGYKVGLGLGVGQSMKSGYESSEILSGAYQAPWPSNNSPSVVGSSAAADSGLSGSPYIQQRQYGRPVMSPQPPAMYSNRGPISKNEAPARVVPIAALNPYQGRWTIKARVTAKGELRRFHNARGEGKVFHFDLLDADGGEIRATCFNNVADQFYDHIELGRLYLISKGSLKASQRSFNHLKNEWEIFLESTSTVEPCFDEDGSIPQQQFDFRPIGEIENLENNAMVDVIGVVVAVNPTSTIMRKNGVETQKRTLQLRDNSGKSVEVTIWGAFCSREGQELQALCDSGQYPILAVKAGRVSDFSGKSVGTISTTQLLINPDIPAAHRVREWFDREGKTTASQSISKEGGTGARIEMRKTITQIKDEGLGRSDKPDWIAVKATIAFIKTDNFCYTACSMPIGDRQCNKKVTNNGDGTWRCDRCDRSVPECDYRYLLSVQVQDHSGVTWITAFQEAGEEIIGVSAKELYVWKQDENPRFADIIQSLLFTQHLFRLKVKEENYNDEQRLKCTVVRSDKLVYASESRLLIDLIGKVSRGEAISAPNTMNTAMLNSGPSYMGGTTAYGNSSYGGSNSIQRDVKVSSEPAFAYSGNASGGFSGGYGGNGSMGTYAAASTGAGTCFKCGKDGHFARDCDANGARGASSFGGGYGGMGPGRENMSSTNSCFKCGQGGHWARDCPNQGGGTSGGVSGGFGGGYSNRSLGTSGGGCGGGY